MEFRPKSIRNPEVRHKKEQNELSTPLSIPCIILIAIFETDKKTDSLIYECMKYAHFVLDPQR